MHNSYTRQYTKPKNKEFKLEQYLCQPQNINHTYSLVTFRISSHHLHIETGRYTQPKTAAEQRICIHCYANEIQDEIQFLLNCSLYIPERTELLNVMKPL